MKIARPSVLSRTLALVPPVTLLVAEHASGGFSGYLKIDGIKGESTDAKHADWIEVLSFTFDVKRPEGSTSGGGDTARPIFSPINIVKKLDASTTSLFLKVADGSVIPTVTLELVRSDSAAPFYRMVLSDVVVTSLSGAGAAGADEISESVSLNYAKIELEYVTVDAKTGTTKGSTQVVWDIAKAKAE